MGQEPDEVRHEIEETRSRIGDTVDAIGHKADVKGRVGEYVSEKKDVVVGKKDELAERIPDAETVKRRGRRAASIARDNPLALGFAGAAVGFLVGLLVPSTRVEDERVGSVADDLKERVRDTGEQALESGKHVARDVKDSAVETARESAREEGGELSSSLRESAEEVASRTPRSGPAGSGRPGGGTS